MSRCRSEACLSAVSLLPSQQSGAGHPCPAFRDAINLVVPLVGLVFSGVSFSQWLFYGYYLLRCQETPAAQDVGMPPAPKSTFCQQWGANELFGSGVFLLLYAVPSVATLGCLLLIGSVNVQSCAAPRSSCRAMFR